MGGIWYGPASAHIYGTGLAGAGSARRTLIGGLAGRRLCPRAGVTRAGVGSCEEARRSDVRGVQAKYKCSTLARSVKLSKGESKIVMLNFE